MSGILRDVGRARGRGAVGRQAGGEQARGLLAEKPGTVDRLGMAGHDCNCNGE